MSLKNWNVVAASNNAAPPNGAPEGMTFSDTNNIMRQIMADVRYLATSDTIASASTCDLGSKDSTFLTITGTTTINGFGTVDAGIYKFVIFAGALTLTYNATSLILRGGASRVTAAGDCALFLSLGGGNWREIFASAEPLAAQLTTLAGITAQQAADLASVSTFIGTLLNDADAPTARTTLGVANLLRITRYSAAGSGTWTKPADTNKIRVRLVGGGAGGDGSQANYAGYGGGAGGYCESFLTALSASYAYTVGAGGAGGAAGAGVGGNGTDTTFSTLAAGGGVGHQGGTASGGQINIPGGGGGQRGGYSTSGNFGDGTGGGSGGSSYFGGGAGTTGTATNGAAGTFGGGGSGAGMAGSYVGGAGGAGYIEIEEYS